MNICKETEVKAIGRADETELAQINRLTRRELMADEVYTFAVRLCDNDIDRDGERFADETLTELGQLFVGVSGVFDHQWTAKGQNARIYRTEVVKEPALCTADGRPYAWLKGWAYMVRTQDEEDALFAESARLRREQGIPDGEFYHFDTPCTVDNQIKLLKAAGFSEALEIWCEGNTVIIKAIR